MMATLLEAIAANGYPPAELYNYRAILATHAGAGASVLFGTAGVTTKSMAAGKIRVITAHANDVVAGAGVQGVYLDVVRQSAPGVTFRDVIDLPLTVAPGNNDTTETDIVFLNRIFATSVGAGGSAAGIIQATDLGTAAVLDQISVGETIGETFGIQVPTNSVGILYPAPVGASPVVPGSDARVDCRGTSKTIEAGAALPGTLIPEYHLDIPVTLSQSVMYPNLVRLASGSRTYLYVVSTVGLPTPLYCSYDYTFVRIGK
jgi:hypothetical protein